MRASLIVAAGGSGSRFKASLKKEKAVSPGNFNTPSKVFSSLHGRPLLIRTLQAFQNIPEISETVIAAPKDAEKFLFEMTKKWGIKNIKIARGGATRAESVWNALKKTNPKNEWVLVHDGARPFISQAAVSDLMKASRKIKSAILGRKVIPTVKEVASSGKILRTVDRSTLFEAETPQMTQRSLLIRAYRKAPKPFEATDEASLLEAAGNEVHFVAHTGWNPKITTYTDWTLAEAYLMKGETNAAMRRTGFGRDTHRLAAGRKLMLGGLHIPFEKGTLGHSDGDALLHAVSDAVLGVLAAGDIGEWFSDKNPKFKNKPSSRFLETILEEAGKRGWQLEHVDTVITLERPKLSAYKFKIKNNMAKLMKLAPENVSIKAKTMEGLGPEGEGLAVTCEAIVTMKFNESGP